MLEFELDIVQRELDRGSNVIFAWCRGSSGYCPANNPSAGQQFAKSKCVSCKSRVKVGLDWLLEASGSLEETSIRATTAADRTRIQGILRQLESAPGGFLSSSMTVASDDEVCWQSAVSGLATDLKDSNPDLSANRPRFLQMLKEALESQASMKNLLDRFNPDEVYIFNGRMPRYWPAVDVAKRAGVPYKIYEYPAKGDENYLLLPGVRPHDRESYAELSKKMLADAETRDGSKHMSRAISWFEDMKIGKREGKQAQYLRSQSEYVEASDPPPQWRESKTRVAIFPSSQYEFANLPSHRGHLSLDQPRTIEQMLRRFPDFAFCVRLHPFQPSSDVVFLAKIKALGAFENCFLEFGPSGVDSYALGAEASISITFGSTIGVELASQGLKVIECGPPFYSSFGAAESAVTNSVLHEMLAAVPHETRQSVADKKLRIEAARRAIAAQFASGVQPKYLRKESYFEAMMLRAGVETAISPTGSARFWSAAMRIWERPEILKQLTFLAAKKILRLRSLFHAKGQNPTRR